MEPDLITQKTLKKILKKNYFHEESVFNKFFKSINNNNIISRIISRINWLPIIVTLFIIIVLIFLYNEQQIKKNKIAEKLEIEKEMDIINGGNKEDFDDNYEYKSKLNYESEYYKMLPRVTNNPEVTEYMY